MEQDLTGKYLLKQQSEEEYEDVTTLFDGVRILQVSGMNSLGEAINVYNEQWVDGSTDFVIASTDGKIKRKNITIEVVFVVSERYASNAGIDTQEQYDAFIDYMTESDIYIKSLYTDKTVHCFATRSFLKQYLSLCSYIFCVKILCLLLGQVEQSLTAQFFVLSAYHVWNLQGCSTRALRIREYVKLRYWQFVKQIVCLFEILGSLATSTHHNVYAKECVGHKSFDEAYLLCKESGVIVAVH